MVMERGGDIDPTSRIAVTKEMQVLATSKQQTHSTLYPKDPSIHTTAMELGVFGEQNSTMEKNYGPCGYYDDSRTVGQSHHSCFSGRISGEAGAFVGPLRCPLSRTPRPAPLQG